MNAYKKYTTITDSKQVILSDCVIGQCNTPSKIEGALAYGITRHYIGNYELRIIRDGTGAT
ncbi:MAG: hypothetical protein RMY62_019530 [Nostoc sp. ZfuVER08]|uniref:Uncharacterized protein n=1 Tax=Nostoc punctiforme FACHB-252 TaxID=1357509 RepID=A0ABR8HL04_NOSPU|nr:hypothetical protein [Nostoc punctiforme]MBD2615775.1 hypothetical protein [Nostoc punctiforme FACHB-252]MBL1202302.1 hypothetical protein [Nostoc sp. GBBB01]MDZ8014417.1 hypothetical protein [Nostoc sp. ZfuVER08]